MKKIVILYSKTGGGHLSAAKSVVQALNTFCPKKFEVVLFDPLPKEYAIAYERLGSDLQSIWGAGWHATNHEQVASLFSRASAAFSSPKITKFIQKNKPDLVISNHPLITDALLKIKKLFPNIKTAIHVADPFSPHLVWFSNKECDLYLCPTKEVLEKAIQSGISKEKTQLVGWLVRDGFNTLGKNREEILKINGLNPQMKTVFIGGAGQGGGKLIETVTELLNLKGENNFQIILNTGVNKKIINQATSLSGVSLFPYLKSPEYLMFASDVIIGKAGPNFMFECLAIDKPILANGCLPGQEEGNLEFIKKFKVGWVKEDPKTAAQLAIKLLQEPKLIEEKRKNIKTVSNVFEGSNKRVAHSIAKLLDQ